jgi:hypothetical protein
MFVTVIKLARAARLPVGVIATYLLCVSVHEAGHALATHLLGGQVKSFTIFSLTPHVAASGTFSAAGNAWRSAAGSALFLLFWAGLVTLAPRPRHTRPIYVTGASFFALAEVLGWFLSALTFPNGPRSYDSWKFIQFSGLNPHSVAAACVVLALMGLALLHLRRPTVRFARSSVPGTPVRQPVTPLYIQ